MTPWRIIWAKIFDHPLPPCRIRLGKKPSNGKMFHPSPARKTGRSSFKHNTVKNRPTAANAAVGLLISYSPFSAPCMAAALFQFVGSYCFMRSYHWCYNFSQYQNGYHTILSAIPLFSTCLSALVINLLCIRPYHCKHTYFCGLFLCGLFRFYGSETSGFCLLKSPSDTNSEYTEC